MAEIWGAAIAVAGAAYGAYSSKQQADAAKKAAANGQADIGGDIMSYINGYKQGMPSILNMEGKHRKQFQDLNLNEAGNFMFGNGQNLFRLQNIANKNAAGELQGARGRDIRGMGQQAGIARSLFDSLSPEAAAQVQASNAEAQRATEAAKGLTGQEQRSAEQFAREQGSASGRIGDNSTIASALLNRDSVLAGKRAEASTARQSAFDMGQSFYQQPGMNLLSMMPQSYQAGQGLLGIGLSSIGSATPQLVNPDMGINVGAANRQNQLGAASAAAQASAAQQAALYGAMGNAASSYFQYRK